MPLVEHFTTKREEFWPLSFPREYIENSAISQARVKALVCDLLQEYDQDIKIKRLDHLRRFAIGRRRREGDPAGSPEWLVLAVGRTPIDCLLELATKLGQDARYYWMVTFVQNLNSLGESVRNHLINEALVRTDIPPDVRSVMAIVLEGGTYVPEPTTKPAETNN